MSGRRARVQSNESLNLVLLDPGSGTEPEIDFPDHDQDAGDDEACVAANTNRCVDIPAKNILNENLRTTQQGQFDIWEKTVPVRDFFSKTTQLYGPR